MRTRASLSALRPSRLQVSLLFSQYDLIENRQGRLTYGQRRRILWSTAYLPILAAGTLVAMALFELRLMAAGIILFYGQPLAFFLGIVVALSLLGAWRPHLLDAFFGRVQVAEGDLVRKSTMGIWRRVHYVRISGRAFDLPKWARRQFGDGQWRLYYLPRTGRLLSAERADGG